MSGKTKTSASTKAANFSRSSNSPVIVTNSFKPRSLISVLITDAPWDSSGQQESNELVDSLWLIF